MSTLSQSHVDPAMEATQTHESTIIKSEESGVESQIMPEIDDDEYYAGMIDAQMNVTLSKSEQVRVMLVSSDARVAEYMSARFMPSRITIVKRPQKKDVCTILFLGDQSRPLLEFAKEHCKLKNTVAEKTLQFMDKKVQADALHNVPINTNVDSVSLDYASGMFDVRGIVTMPVPATETTKRKRGNVKLVMPKSEQFLVPALQRVLHGRVKKASPCRLVYENRELIGTLKSTVEHHVRAKRQDLMMLD